MQQLPEINNIATLKAAFAQIKEEHPDIKHFLSGTYFDLIAETRSNIAYPCLMLELPENSYKDNRADYRIKYLEGAFIVLQNKRTNTQDEKITILDQLDIILEDIIARLQYESVTYRKFHFEVDNTEANIISTVTQDLDIGYRYEFRIGRTKGMYHDKTKWL
jgi:hypothetical protein